MTATAAGSPAERATTGPHRPPPGRPVPTSTYRLQLQPAFTFAQAAAQAGYLRDLGVSHAYFSPVLDPAPGSTHGYDVISHDRFNRAAGGDRFAESVRALRAEGLGVVVDVVPNHMTTPTPAWLNERWWGLLEGGRAGAEAAWFDVDWEAEDGRVLVPVLGAPLQEVLRSGELMVAGDGGPSGDRAVLRYHDHEFPLAPGTNALGAGGAGDGVAAGDGGGDDPGRTPVQTVLDAQHYRLCHWREGGTRLNYRRFFDVTTLVAIRVEDAAVFQASHHLLLDAYRSGLVDGFRIDHPDGLANPRGYLSRLAEETGDAWVVVEKILEGHEELPSDWRCAGTTGYDVLLRVGGVFVDPAGEAALTGLASAVVGRPQNLAEMVTDAKRQVVEQVQAAEVNRLLRLARGIVPDADPASLRRGLEALLVAMDRYRAYLLPEEPADPGQLGVLSAAHSRAVHALPEEDRESLEVIVRLARGEEPPGTAAGAVSARRDFVVRFQQTCGPVMAKGVEDTAFYRHVRLTALNEVGGDPGRVGVEPAELHEFAARLLATWPTTMTTLTTHDTKRSEDVRARLAVLSELPGEWAAWLDRARGLAAAFRAPLLDPATEYLLWQTAVGAWPVDERRLQTYATKAVREAKVHTRWTDPDPAYEASVARFVTGVTTDAAVGAHLDAWTTRTAPAARATILGQKLLQLVVPGVPDVYQGTELVSLTLVDPDNRLPVDVGAARERLARLDRGAPPRDLDDEKLTVTSRALRLRRDHPEWFTGPTATYAALRASSGGAEHALAVARGDEGGVGAVAVVTRLSERLADRGGWGDAELTLEPGPWRDLITAREVATDSRGSVRLSELLADLPVALIVRDERARGTTASRT